MVGADVPGGPRSPKAFPKVSPWARRAGDVAPYQGRGQDVGMVGADVPGGPRSRRRPHGRPCVPEGVPDGVLVCAARWKRVSPPVL